MLPPPDQHNFPSSMPKTNPTTTQDHPVTRNRPWPFHPSNRLPDLRFWLGFLSLNILLFLPMYWLNLATMTFLPAPSIFADGWSMGIARLLLWRENLDLFRLNVEFTVLLALWMN